MLISIRHSTHYTYERVGSFAVQRLRLTPRDNPGQTVRSWSVNADGVDQSAQYEDCFGNHVHLVTHCKPFEEIVITAEGLVDTEETGGVVGDLDEAANPRLFLRSTPLTQSSPAIDALADGLGGRHALDNLHRLLEAIAKQVAYVKYSTDQGTSAAEAFAAGQGVCQDHAHIFIAAARRLGIPGRYVSGYLHVDSETGAVANHAWAEAYVRDLGWVGFDAANDVCPTEHYVRLACGFDAPSAAPIVGSRRGGGRETLAVDLVVRQQQQ